MTSRTGPTGASRAYVALAAVMLLWAGNSIVGRAVRDDIAPFTLALVRWTGALLILLPFAWRHLRDDAVALRAAWRVVLALGLIGIAAFNALLYAGLHHTTASNGLLLQAAIPALVLVFDRVAFGVRPGLATVAGVTLSTLGVVVIVTRADPAVLRHFDFGRGDVMILIAVTAWAVYTTLLRLRPAVHPLSLIAATFAIGVLAMLPLAMIEIARVGLPALTPTTIGAFAYVAIFPSLIAYQLYNTAVAHVGPARAGQAITLMPLFGALLAVGLLGETLHGYHAVGMGLILAGILVTMLTRARS